MDFKELFKAFKESGSELTFSEWKAQASNSNKQEEITPEPENITLKEDVSQTKQRVRWATSAETGQKVRVKNWDEFKVKKHLYLSKGIYERLKNAESISDKVNRILTKYFEEIDKKGNEENERGIDENV